MPPAMMPDVNVLNAASRSNRPHHNAAYAYLEEVVAACADDAGLNPMPIGVANFLRLVTNLPCRERPLIGLM
ncbi:MAG: hypothetical protein NT159_18080 [Proteobacteria bacterium]|nr:hypothetical protein [Pseudomonadota bacterium]